MTVHTFRGRHKYVWKASPLQTAFELAFGDTFADSNADAAYSVFKAGWQAHEALPPTPLQEAAPELLEVLQDLMNCRQALMLGKELPITVEEWEAKAFATLTKATRAL